MGLKIDKARAKRIVRDAVAEARLGHADAAWVKKVERLSDLCEQGGARTHIAFLGTAMIAKATHRDVDLFAIKPTSDPGNPNAYSARSLCHSVLVPLAVDLRFDIGVSGREPLNNQPYFRIRRLGDGTPVHPRGRAAFEYVVKLVKELQDLSTETQARKALVAFVDERSRRRLRYEPARGSSYIAPEGLVLAVKTLVASRSERGRRAQAVVAGLMDAFAGPQRVESGRVNDPSRRHPGDVCVRSTDGSDAWEKAFEVRDKPVSLADIQIFAQKCFRMGVHEAAVVAVSGRQSPLDTDRLAVWASEIEIGVTFFDGWEDFVDQALFWSPDPKPVTASRAIGAIHQRLIAVEASPDAVELWLKLTS